LIRNYLQKRFKRGTCQRGTSVFDLGVGSALSGSVEVHAEAAEPQSRKNAESYDRLPNNVLIGSECFINNNSLLFSVKLRDLRALV